MERTLRFMAYGLVMVTALAPELYAGKAGAAIGGFIGGTIVGSALSAPRYQETVIVREPAPAPVIVSSSGSSTQIRQENRELREDNRYLDNENIQLQRDLDALNRENADLRRDNSELRKENMQLRQELNQLKQPVSPKK